MGIEESLAVLNAILAQVSPLVPATGLLIRMFVALFKKNGIDIGPFATEIAEYEAALSRLQIAIDALPKPAPTATPPAPAQP